MKLRFITILLNWSNNRWKGNTQIPHNKKIQKHQFLLKKLWLQVFGTGEAFSSLTLCLKAKQLLLTHIVRHWDIFDRLCKTKGGEFCCSTNAHITPALLTARNRILWIIHCIAWTPQSRTFSRFFTWRNI